MKRIYFSITAVILFVLLFPAISSASSWPSQNFNNQNNPVSFDAANYKNTSSYNIKINYSSSGYAYPISAEGKLFYIITRNSYDVTLVASNIKDGQTIWSKNFNRQILNIVYENGNLYFGAGIIYCLNANDGSTIWTVDKDLTGNIITTSRVYKTNNGTVYANEVHGATGDSEALVLNNSGQVISDLNHFRTTRVVDVLADDSNFYLINDGSFQAQSVVSAFNIASNTFLWQQGCTAGSSAMLDKNEKRIYLASSSYACGVSTVNGQKIFDGSLGSYYGFAKYGDRIYASAYMSMISFPSNYTTGNFNYGEFPFQAPERFSTAPIIVNDTIYYGSSKGRVWGKNLETGQTQTWQTSSLGGYIYYLAYANGKLIIVNSLGSANTEMIVKDINDMSLRPGNYTVSLDSPYKTDGDYLPLLGQLHAHYVSDYDLSAIYKRWSKTPMDVADRYLAAGYDFIAITEHDAITQSLDLTDILDVQYSEEDTEAPSKHHILAIGINGPIDENNSDQNRVNQINEQGGLAFLPHPNANVYSESFEQLMSLDGYSGIEIFNSGVNKWYLVAGEPYALDKWDDLLTSGKNVWATSGDDYTPWDGGFDGGAVVVFSKTKSQPDIMQNLKDGNFYALQGSGAPRINITTTGNLITVNSDRQSIIKFIGKGGKTLLKIDDTNTASYSAVGDETYVRAEVEAGGKTAWTQPIKVNKTRIAQTLNAGGHYTDLGQAGLISNSAAPVNAIILPALQYPAQTPPLGYLSPVYSFATSGQILDGTKLSISYADKNIATNDSNLAIYTYNEATSVWEKITSTVDSINKVVSVDLSHFSLYTLSAEQPEDLEVPVISLISPTDLTNLSGQINFEANATDNNAVTEVNFIVDGKLIAKDSEIADGWKTEINANDFSAGNHQLKLQAEDFAGNVGVFETNFTIADSTFVAPTVSLVAPINEQYLKISLVVSGNYSSQNEVKNISVFLNDIYLTDADLASGTFQKEIDFSQFKEGKHQLKIILADVKDNVAEVTTTINVGDELKANIIFPQNKTYLHSGSILFKYQTIPVDATGVVSKLDGVEIANNTTKNAYDLSLGQHKYTVEKNGKVYAEQDFTILTSLVDLIKLTDIMYKTGHIKNRGVATAIQAQLALAQLFNSLNMKNLRNITIQKTIKFIEQQNKQKKPLIDNYAKLIFVSDLNSILAK